MNALVNDQLGRLRSLFGDHRIVALFNQWTQRPPRFAQCTSRTPYAGVRTRDKDSRKLRAFGDFYVEIQRRAQGPASNEQQSVPRIYRSSMKWRPSYSRAVPSCDTITCSGRGCLSSASRGVVHSVTKAPA
jgi:predicted TIM-barrel fold metal-dependent hydrolase